MDRIGQNMIDKLPPAERKACEEAIVAQELKDLAIVTRWHLPGVWTVRRHRAKLRKLAQRAIDRQRANTKNHQKHSAEKRALERSEWALDGAQDTFKEAQALVSEAKSMENPKDRARVAAVALSKMDQAVQTYIRAVQTFGWFTGELAQPGANATPAANFQFAGGLQQIGQSLQQISVMSLPRCDDPPELIEAAARMVPGAPAATPMEPGENIFDAEPVE